MDLVIGRIGGVCLLTLHWLNAGFMVGILIPNKCAENVTAVFDRLYAELGHELFARLFQVVLTDRGTEFSNPSRIEKCLGRHAQNAGVLLRGDELQPKAPRRIYYAANETCAMGRGSFCRNADDSVLYCSACSQNMAFCILSGILCDKVNAFRAE